MTILIYKSFNPLSDYSGGGPIITTCARLARTCLFESFCSHTICWKYGQSRTYRVLKVLLG